METFQRDTEYIIRQAGLETLLLNKVPKTKEQKITNRSAKNDTTAVIPRWVTYRKGKVCKLSCKENLIEQTLNDF